MIEFRQLVNHKLQQYDKRTKTTVTKLVIFGYLAAAFGLVGQNLVAREKVGRGTQYQEENRSDTAMTTTSDYNVPWSNSLYISGGYGHQGMRLELGYYYGSYLGFGLTYSYFDYGSDPGNITLGYLVQIRVPIDSSMITPYLLFSKRLVLPFLGNPNTYTLIYLGATIPLTPWLQVRPEMGVAFTSKHVSGGMNLFGPDTPEVTEDRARPSLNVSLEIDFRQLVQKIY